MSQTLLEIKNLRKYFHVSRGALKRNEGIVRAVDGIDLKIRPRETLGLVGESGCGKSTVGKLILSLHQPSDGEILFRNRSVSTFGKSDWQHFRREVQMIFQDPYSSLDPHMRIGRIISEPLRHFKLTQRKELEKTITELLNTVGLHVSFLRRYPHEISGGQRQRVCIARAISTRPNLIICDEPVSALDVSIQAQVLNLLKDLQDEFGLAYLFITHNLSVVRHVSHRIAVMYLGKIIEITIKRVLFETPLHPYTKALLSAIPVPNPHKKSRRIILEGDIPSPLVQIVGCKFRTRCLSALPICQAEEPVLKEVSKDHFVACHLMDKGHA